MRISIVLPAYNEAHGIRYCLDSMAAQTEQPFEVIVVDNNSVDDTARIASSYSFVTVLHEAEQGITTATRTGFRHANGDVIARFNADVVLDPDWVSRTSTFFTDHPQSDGMTGLGDTPLLPYTDIKSPLWAWMYSLGAEAFLGIIPLWGGNYALRAQTAKESIEHLKDMHLYHDDIDLGLYLAYGGRVVTRVWEPRVTTSEVSYGYFPKMLQYLAKTIKTKRQHDHRQFPRTTRLSWLSRAWRFVVCAIPLTLFIMLSVISWPIYYLKMKLVQ